MNEAPIIVRSVEELRSVIKSAKKHGSRIGFVPTMGALHAGHLALLARAKQMSDFTVVSIFVNPTQFAPNEDFDVYPRHEAADITCLTAAGCDVVYLPDVKEIYPAGSTTNVCVEGLSDVLDGVYRPHFFYGVTTVVARLFIHVQPDVAVFGEKDYQQLQIIRRMVRDLKFDIDIVGASTQREADGLALSSRNAYLSAQDRISANRMSFALHRAACRISTGAKVSDALAEGQTIIAQSGFSKIDYLTAIDPVTLEPLPDGPVAAGYRGRLLAAAYLGNTRLIDNIGFERSGS